MSLFVFIWLLGWFPIASVAQSAPDSRTFTHPNDEYKLQLLPEWDAIVYESRSKETVVDIVFRGQRNTALLKIQPSTLPVKTAIDAYVTGLSESSYRLRPGYGFFKKERFGGGKLAGVLAEFEFTQTNKPMLARYYFLADTDRKIWELRFTGDRAAIRGLRNETDAIARSFSPITTKPADLKPSQNH